MGNDRKQFPDDDRLQEEENDAAPFIGARPEDTKGDEPITDEEADEIDDTDETDDTIGNP